MEIECYKEATTQGNNKKPDALASRTDHCDPYPTGQRGRHDQPEIHEGAKNRRPALEFEGVLTVIGTAQGLFQDVLLKRPDCILEFRDISI